MRERGGFVAVVGDEQDGRRRMIEGGPQVGDQVGPGGGVQPGERLVEQQHPRPDGESSGDGHALGLAAGVGRWHLGVALCLFALALLWLLEFNESEQTYRSMELSVKTRDPERTQATLKKIFKRMKIDAEVREIEPPDEKHQIGSIIYYLNLRLTLTTDRLTERIAAADPQNIEGIQWSKTKNASDIYQ